MTRRRGERPKIGFRAAALATVSAVVVGLGGAGVATADPTGGPAGKQWTATHDGKQKYAGVSVRTDVPIRMSDGTVLRADIYRPADARQRPVDTRTPVVVNLTPYTKLLTSLGSAVILVVGLLLLYFGVAFWRRCRRRMRQPRELNMAPHLMKKHD